MILIKKTELHVFLMRAVIDVSYTTVKIF